VRIAAATIVGITALAALGAGSAPSATPSPRSVLDVGDSLSVGTAPYLRAELRGYRITRVQDIGLHADEVVHIVSAKSVAPLPGVLIVSAGTNDDPRLVSRFAEDVEHVVASAGGRRCVVWPNIVRPPAVGSSYAGYNRVLRRAAARHETLEIVDWASLIRKHPGWLGADGVHVSATGYRARASAIAEAVVTRCS
jgi:lysophospholipase L1-like esterase